MKKVASLIGITLVLGLAWGCSSLKGGDPASTSPKPQENSESFALAGNVGASPLAIVNGSEKIKIGDPYFRWEVVFPRPKKAAFEIQELPKPLNQDDLQPVGWESSTRGYGAIRNGRRIVLAMIWQSKLTQEDASKIKNEYYSLNSSLPAEVVTENGSTYTFWENNQIRMMLLVQKTGSDSFNVTVSLGQADLMTAIRASVNQAQNDLAGLSPAGGIPPVKIIPATPVAPRSTLNQNPVNRSGNTSPTPTGSTQTSQTPSQTQPPATTGGDQGQNPTTGAPNSKTGQVSTSTTGLNPPATGGQVNPPATGGSTQTQGSSATGTSHP